MRDRILAALVIVAAIAFVYHPVRGHDFVNLDDYTYVLENPNLLAGFTPGTVWRYFSEPYEHNWIPLTWLSLHVDHLIHGRDAPGYLLTNVVLHALSSLLLLTVLLRMTGALYASAFVALIFAVHPLHVESVAWVSERKDVLSGVFFMLTLLAYARYAGGPARPVRMLPVAALLLLGLLAKPMLVTLPFVLLLLDLWPLGRMRGADGRALDASRLGPLLVEKLPLVAIVAAVSVVTYVVQESTGAVASLRQIPLDERIANALASYVTYLSQTVLPQGLAVLYPYPPEPDWAAAGGAALLLVGATVVAATASRERPYLLVGWLWFVGMLVPVIGIVQVGIQSHADRYMYLPQIGLTIAIAWGAADVVKRTPAARAAHAVVGTLVIAWFAGLAWQQVAFWRDTETLYRRSLAVTEGNYLAHKGLGDALMKRGRYTEALLHYQKANLLRPSWIDAELGIADALATQGGLDEAITIYQRWIEQAPDSARPVGSLGLALLRVGRFEEALAHIESGLALDPDAAELHAGRGAALFGLGRVEEAHDAYRDALRLDPGEPTAANNLAWLLAVSPDPALRSPSEAVRIAEAASRRRPDDPSLLDTLAAAYAADRRFGAAVATADRAAAIAAQRGATALAEEIRARAELYREGRAYVEAGSG